jgi:N-acetylglucosaminyldiphosphoundecaprenol N-acetyl-beta-D-mannosaminyltransferase
MVMRSPQRVLVGGVPVDLCAPAEFVALTTDWARSGRRATAVGINAHVVNLFARDPDFAAAVGGCDLSFPDGQSVVWAARALGHRPNGRVPLTHMTDTMCGAWAAAGLGVYLLGGRPGVADRAADRLRQRYGLTVVGTRDGYFSDSDEVLQEINASPARILMVGLGSPKQEVWVHAQRHRLLPPLVLTCGGWLDWTADERRPCPQWIYRFGLEWAYRLGQEPRRLGRRYLLGNPMFVYRVLRTRAADRRAAAVVAPTPHQ